MTMQVTEENAEQVKEVTCKVSFQRQFYPKNNARREDGEWGIVSVSVEEVLIDGKFMKYDDIPNEIRRQYANVIPEVNSVWGNSITIKGNMCAMEAGNVYKVVATEVYDAKFKRIGYDVKYTQELYDFGTVENQRTFLMRVLTENQVNNLFDAFPNPIEVLEAGDTDSLISVKGIGLKTAEQIVAKYQSSKDYGRAYVELAEYNLTNRMIHKLTSIYGSPDTVVAKIKSNPYVLADEIDGVGFIKADDIAIAGGYPLDSPNRCIAFIKYYFEQMESDGHSYMTGDDMMCAIYDMLGDEYPPESVSVALKTLTNPKRPILWYNEDRTVFALTKNYETERNIASDLFRLLNAENTFKFEDWEKDIAQLEEEQGWQFSGEQRNAIQTTLEYNAALIAGLAGSGKTTSVAGMLRVLKDIVFAQCALSGKASVNMLHITGVEGYTIHRLLAYNPRTGFRYNRENPLPYDVIIIDEFSMVDAWLYSKLLAAIRTGAKVIMLGDTGQLTNIGVGNVMADIIESGIVPCVQLWEVHRQGAKSAIITESRKLRNSEHIVNLGFEGRKVLGELEDLEIVGYKEKENRAQGEDGRGVGLIVNEFKQFYPSRVSDIMDIAVILPTNFRGTCTYKINILLQKYVLNTAMSKGLEIGGDYPYTIYVGDKVIDTKNNYDSFYRECIGNDEQDNPVYVEHPRPVYNGNMGIVTHIDHDRREIEVDFERIGKVTIEKDSLPYIMLGYAISVHKSQGATIPYVIAGVDYSHYKLLSRELVYTGMTRAKTHCVLIAETRALRKATVTTNIKHKQTFLPYFLDGSIPIENGMLFDENDTILFPE